MGLLAVQPMEPRPTWYYVELSGLGVGTRRVSLPEGIFKLTPKGDGGAIIDTISFVTTLPKVSYEAFRDAYVAEAANLPRAPEDSIFDTRFNLTGLGTVQVPAVSFYFGEIGTTLTLSAKNILYLADGVGVY
jgi:putative lipase involved disintegration of autophagic bodies